MAITFDAASVGSIASPAKGTISHTIAAGNNRILIFGASTESNSVPGNVPITGVTYAGSALTNIRADQRVASNRSELWYIVDPNTGANNIVVSFTGTVEGAVFGGVSLQGVDPTNPIDASIGGTTQNGTIVLGTLTTIADNAWIVDVAMGAASTAALTPGAAQTQTFQGTSSTHNIGASSRRGPLSPAAAYIGTWTAAASETEFSLSMVSLKPFVAATNVVTPYRNLLGVGQ